MLYKIITYRRTCMADIKPFCSIRPGKGLEANVAALPYDVYNRQEAKEAVKGNPLSF